MGVVVKIEEKELAIEKGGISEIYSLVAMPKKTSRLVLEGKQEILQELCLDTILINLRNSADLMFVAYNALAKTPMQSKMTGLQKDLLELCSECELSAQIFKNESSRVSSYLVGMYKWLLKGKEDAAIEWLSKCAEAAAKMAKKSEELAASFKELSDRTEIVLEESQDQENFEARRADELRAERRKLEAKRLAKEKDQEMLLEDLQQMQQLYDEAKEKAETERERSFVLGIVTAISSAVGAGVGAFASCYNPASKITSATKVVSSKFDDTEKEVLEKIEKKAEEAESAREKAEEAEQEVIDTQEKIEEIEDEIEEIETELQNEEELEEEEKELKLKEKADKMKELAMQEKKLKKVKANAKKLRSVAKGLSEAIANMSESTAKMQEQAKSAAESINDEKMQYLTKKLEMEKEKRESVAALVEYAKLIENTSIEEGNASAAVETLHVAVSCLKQVVTALVTASKFWRSMEEYCLNLADSELLDHLKIVKTFPVEERIDCYYDEDFVYTLVTYMAKWVALASVCEEYQKAANKTYENVSDNIKAAPTFEEAKLQAPVLASKILASAKEQMDAINANTDKIALEKLMIEA